MFAAAGHLGSPASVTAGFRAALWTCAGFAVLGAVSAIVTTTAGPRRTGRAHAADGLVAA